MTWLSVRQVIDDKQGLAYVEADGNRSDDHKSAAEAIGAMLDC